MMALPHNEAVSDAFLNLITIMTKKQLLVDV